MNEQYPALRYNDNMWEGSKNGILTVECNSWEEFKIRIEEYKNKYKYFWRGQSFEKPLLPSIYRDHNPEYKRIEEHLNNFRKYLPGAVTLEGFLKKRTPEFSRALTKNCKITLQNADEALTEKNIFDDIYWAIGQHHGLKTPILDWTRDPYKALFFAFCERKETNDKRVVFGFAEKSRRLLAKGKQIKRYIEFLDNLDFVKIALCASNIPTDDNERICQMFSRIQKQNRLFTRTLLREDIEEQAKMLYNKFKNSEGEIIFLIKILIPDGVRKEFLEKLELKEITYKTMYPDLQGAALHCNLKLQSLDS